MAKNPKSFVSNEDTNRLKSCLRDFITERLTPSRGKDKTNWCCPFCGSGTGGKATGAFTILPDEIHWYCRSCGRKGDIYDLAQRLCADLSDFNQAVLYIRDWSERHGGVSAVSVRRSEIQPKAVQDQKQYLEMWCQTFKPQARLFLSLRGISERTARDTGTEFVVGHNPKRYFQGKTEHPAIIIPTTTADGKYLYVARNTDYNPETMSCDEKWYIHHGSFYRLAAMYQPNPVFVCESAIDCMSFVELGAEALAINSTTNDNRFMDYAIDHYNEIQCGELILAFDNDRSGVQATELIQSRLIPSIMERYHLTSCKLKVSKYNGLSGTPYKDVNDYLVNDRERFERSIHHG